MKKHRLLILLTILTLIFIWGNSLLPASASSSLSLWIAERLLSIFGTVPSDTGHHLLRKLAHATEYMILGLELGLLFRRDRPWYFGMLLGLAAAFVDETIQLYSPGRAGVIADMWIDLGGCFVGTVIARILPRKEAA